MILKSKGPQIFIESLLSYLFYKLNSKYGLWYSEDVIIW